MSKQPQRLYEFGPFRLDAAEQQLLRNGEPVPLTPKAFETLALLVEKSGHLVEKDELMQTLWPDSFVEESNLTNNIWTLRKSLGEDQKGLRYIETVPKRGYRFIAPVKQFSEDAAPVRHLPDAGEELVIEKHTLKRVVTEEEDEEITRERGDAEMGQKILTLPASSTGYARPRAPVSLKILAACILLVGAAASVFLYSRWSAGQTAKSEAGVAANQPQPRSIVVLPFKTIGAASDDDSDYLALGMSDALITRLGNLRQIIVRPASAVRRYADAQGDIVVAGREQGVDAVLDGSLQRQGERIRVTVQLVRVQDRAVLWSGLFDERLTDIFAVQDSISRQVAEGLSVKLSAEERGRLQKRGPQNIEAYQAYLRGRYFWNKRTLEGFHKAVEHFNHALELDPAYAQAYAGLADAILYRGGNGATQKEAQEDFAKSRAALRKALEIDETLAEAHATLGLLAMNLDWDWPEAEREFKRAIELNPNYATAHQWYGEFLVYMGRFDEAVAEIKRAQELDPLSLIINTDVAKVYALARRYDEAIEQFQKALEMDPEFAEAHALLAMTYSMNGNHEEAIRELRKIKDLESNAAYLSWLGYVYGQAGKQDEGLKTLNRLESLSKRKYVSSLWMAIIYTGLGEKEQAFKWFERVFGERAGSGAISLKVNPIFDSLRSDPRFANLLRRANFLP